MSEQRKPRVLAARWVSHSRLFHVEEQRLRFSNGVERTYERLNPGFHGAVMVVPVRADGRLLLQSMGFDAPKEAGQAIAQLQKDSAALQTLAPRLAPVDGVDAAEVTAALQALAEAAA